ncbi:MAG: hypothetical protein WCG22_07680 [Lentisphaerota bacterium]
MNAKPYLDQIAAWFSTLNLDAVMIGNAAAAINGAPVTTLDVDFMIQPTDENYRKLAALAQRMNCQFVELKLMDGNYMYRLIHRSEPIIIDFLFAPSGLDDFEAVSRRSSEVFFAGNRLRIAALEDILASKKAAARPKDLASIPILEMTIDERQKQ